VLFIFILYRNIYIFIICYVSLVCCHLCCMRSLQRDVCTFNICITFQGCLLFLLLLLLLLLVDWCCWCAFSYLAGLEIIFHTMLKAFSFRLQRCHDETVPHKVSRVTDSFAGAETAGGIRQRYISVSVLSIQEICVFKRTIYIKKVMAWK